MSRFAASRQLTTWVLSDAEPSRVVDWRAYGMRVRRYTLRRGSGAAGQFPGGEGVARDLEMLEDATVSLITE